MLDVVLLALRVAFVALLYLFVYLVVRRTGAAVLSSARVSAAPDIALPDAAPQPSPAVTPAARRARRKQRHTERTTPGETFDLTAHIDPRLVVVDSPVLAPGTEIRLEAGVTMGRAPTSDVVLDDPFVSQTHARVVPRGQLHYVEDLGSTNGTLVNGRNVTEAQLLIDSELRVGETVFRYEE